jgi:glyoxylase I family protein
MQDAHRAANVRQLWPLLEVGDIERSVQFYRDQLGFVLVADDGGGGQMRWCRLERGGASIMLQQAKHHERHAWGRRRGISLYFVCDDVDALHGELTSRGVAVEPPQVAYYGMKQLEVPEPDGYAICFESPTEGWRG